MIWLDNELSLFKQNIEILRVNQRIGRLAFLWAVLGLMCSKFLAYFLIVVLEEFVHDVSFQGSTYLSYIYFGSLQIIHIVVTIFLLKRRLNVNVNIRMYNFDDVQCTVIPSVAYGFVTGMNLQLC